MATAFTDGTTAIDTKVTGVTVNATVKVSIPTLLVVITMATGHTIISTAKAMKNLITAITKARTLTVIVLVLVLTFGRQATNTLVIFIKANFTVKALIIIVMATCILATGFITNAQVKVNLTLLKALITRVSF